MLYRGKVPVKHIFPIIHGSHSTLYALLLTNGVVTKLKKELSSLLHVKKSICKVKYCTRNSQIRNRLLNQANTNTHKESENLNECNNRA